MYWFLSRREVGHEQPEPCAWARDGGPEGQVLEASWGRQRKAATVQKQKGCTGAPSLQGDWSPLLALERMVGPCQVGPVSSWAGGFLQELGFTSPSSLTL